MGFSKNTPIMMSNGTTKYAKNIQAGDKIMCTDGSYQTITKVIKNKEEMYDVTPIKGTKYTISKNHNLLLKISFKPYIKWCTDGRYRVRWLEKFSMRSLSFSVKKYAAKERALFAAKKFLKNEIPLKEEYTKYGSVVNITIEKFSKLSKTMQAQYKGFSKGIDFDNNEVDVDPYIFGYWLGDGDSSGTKITTAEPEIVQYFEYYAEENDLVFKKIGDSKYDYTLSTGQKYGKKNRNFFMNFLRSNNLINNKHIPKDYLTSSKENRLDLLAGLVDSDGHNQNNGYDFIFKSKKLANDIIFLARSLGFKAFSKKVQKTCTNSKNGPVTGTYYRFFIYGSGLEKVPSLLDRKQTHERRQIKDPTVTGFAVNYVGKQDSYTFKMTGNKLLLDDFTVVHK